MDTQEFILNVHDLPNKKYDVIYADPPWKESGGGKIKRGADRHYKLLSTKKIAAIPIKKISKENCHLFLWVTNNFLIDGLEVMKSWGFRYITMITWAKDRFGLGQYFRGQTEHCLFGIKGQGFLVRQGQGVTLITAPKTKHSAKPKKKQVMIEKVSKGKRIELFARGKTKGWDIWGDQV